MGKTMTEESYMTALLTLPDQARRSVFKALSACPTECGSLRQLIGDKPETILKTAQIFIKNRVDVSGIASALEDKLAECAKNITEENRLDFLVRSIEKTYTRQTRLSCEKDVSGREERQSPVDKFINLINVSMAISMIIKRSEIINKDLKVADDKEALWTDEDIEYILDRNLIINPPSSVQFNDFLYYKVQTIMGDPSLYICEEKVKQMYETLDYMGKEILAGHNGAILTAGLYSRSEQTVRYAIELRKNSHVKKSFGDLCVDYRYSGYFCCDTDVPFLFMTLPFYIDRYICNGDIENIKKRLCKEQNVWFDEFIKDTLPDGTLKLYVPFAPNLADLIKSGNVSDIVLFEGMSYSDALICGTAGNKWFRFSTEEEDIPRMYEYLKHTSQPFGSLESKDIALSTESFLRCVEGKVTPMQFCEAYLFAFKKGDSMTWKQSRVEFTFLNEVIDFTLKSGSLIFGDPITYSDFCEFPNSTSPLLKRVFDLRDDFEQVDLSPIRTAANLCKAIDRLIASGKITWREIKESDASDFEDILLKNCDGENAVAKLKVTSGQFKRLMAVTTVNLESNTSKSTEELVNAKNIDEAKFKLMVTEMYENILAARHKFFGRNYERLSYANGVQLLFGEKGCIAKIRKLYWKCKIQNYTKAYMNKVDRIFTLCQIRHS